MICCNGNYETEDNFEIFKNVSFLGFLHIIWFVFQVNIYQQMRSYSVCNVRPWNVTLYAMARFMGKFNSTFSSGFKQFFSLFWLISVGIKPNSPHQLWKKLIEGQRSLKYWTVTLILENLQITEQLFLNIVCWAIFVKNVKIKFTRSFHFNCELVCQLTWLLMLHLL